MKKILFLFFVILLIYNNLKAQIEKIDSELSKNLKVDFAISDAPAFKILGNEPSNLLRPSSSDVISFIASNILNPSDITFPNSYTAEISPALLIRNNKMTISEFKNNYFLYNLRLSLGTTKDSKTNKYNLGIGLRSTIIDKGDFRKDDRYNDKILMLLEKRENYKDQIMERFKKIYNCNLTDKECENKYRQFEKDELKKYEDNAYDGIREEYQKENWNKEKLDFALAILGTSPDSLAKNIELSRFSAWSTFAYPLYDWGQILLGGNINYNVLSEKGSGSLATRIYGGNNNVKGFIESQYKKDNSIKSTNWLLNVGVELNLSKGLWLVYYAGYENMKINNDVTSKFVSQFDLKFALQ